MTTMLDTLLQQVTEQVKKTMEVVSSTMLLPTFDYAPTARYELSHRHAHTVSLLKDYDAQEIVRHEINRQPQEQNRSQTTGIDAS